MASSKVMPTNPDPPRGQSPPKHYHHLPKSSFGSINMDDIISNIYADPNSFPGDGGGDKTADEVWKEIVAGREPEMTLEDFLSKAGAVGEEVGEPALPGLGFGTGPAVPEGVLIQGGTVLVGRGAGGGGGRGKRRAAVEEPPMDKATQQKQRRMIKNRESAARSRERKQAYTVELEALVIQLEEENARLVKEEAEESKKRLKQLMENLIPVEDKLKPPRIQTLRRSNSMHWKV